MKLHSQVHVAIDTGAKDSVNKIIGKNALIGFIGNETEGKAQGKKPG